MPCGQQLLLRRHVSERGKRRGVASRNTWYRPLSHRTPIRGVRGTSSCQALELSSCKLTFPSTVELRLVPWGARAPASDLRCSSPPNPPDTQTPQSYSPTPRTMDAAAVTAAEIAPDVVPADALTTLTDAAISVTYVQMWGRRPSTVARNPARLAYGCICARESARVRRLYWRGR
mgnify:CR=1 FL=1